MAEPLALTDHRTTKSQLLNMGFEPKYIDHAFKLFHKQYGDDYKIDILVELTMQEKNKQLEISKQMSNHNKQTIGTQLYYQIYSFEPVLASKITGMMLQWDTHKLIQLLNNPLQLQQLIDEAKCALANVSFKSHMDLIMAQSLKPGDKIDFRRKTGKYTLSTVLKKSNTELFIHFDNLSYLFDTCCDYKKELYRFAVSGSISARPPHRLQLLTVGDMIDFKPLVSNNWTYGKIVDVESNSGQIEVMYEFNSQQFVQWTHKDNINEIAIFRTKQDEYVHISMDLLNWKALETNCNAYASDKDVHRNIKNVLLLNNNDIIVVSDRNIYKYQTNMNKWMTWMEHQFEITACCLSENKKILYILSAGVGITQLDLLSFKCKTYIVMFPRIPNVMLMVDDTLHFFAYHRRKRIGMHYIWKVGMQHPKLELTFNKLSSYNNHSLNTTFIYCKQRNVLLLFGNVFENKLFVYSLKQNKWSISFISNHNVNNTNAFNTVFGFVLTNDEKYVMIFAGEICYDIGLTQSHWGNHNHIGEILLLDISNSKLIKSESINFLLKNTYNALQQDLNYTFGNYKIWYPIIINKTTILIEGYLKQCWMGNSKFTNMRLISDDVISIIKGYYGYDNDELFLYFAYKGYLWNAKVSEIIKYKLPKLKFCADPKILHQEQQKIAMLKNQLLKKHNDLTLQIQQQHATYQQQYLMYQQHSGFMQSFQSFNNQ